MQFPQEGSRDPRKRRGALASSRFKSVSSYFCCCFLRGAQVVVPVRAAGTAACRGAKVDPATNASSTLARALLGVVEGALAALEGGPSAARHRRAFHAEFRERTTAKEPAAKRASAIQGCVK